MLEGLKSLFLGESRPAEGDPSEDLRLAAAALLVEAAVVDGAMTDREYDLIERLLRERFALSAVAADELLEHAAALDKETSQLFPFTKTIVDQSAADQRVGLIEMLWEVAYVDGVLHDYEASLVRRVAGLLFVSDHDSGAARQRAIARLGGAGGPAV
jgi:uncharacterized tellurite resistance protein B-like protein